MSFLLCENSSQIIKGKHGIGYYKTHKFVRIFVCFSAACGLFFDLCAYCVWFIGVHCITL